MTARNIFHSDISLTGGGGRGGGLEYYYIIQYYHWLSAGTKIPDRELTQLIILATGECLDTTIR